MANNKLPTNVTRLDDARPHVTVQTPGQVHVIPLKLLHDIAVGDKPMSYLPDAVYRRMLQEWLDAVARGVFQSLNPPTEGD